MDTNGVESLIVQIDSFLQNQIKTNPRSPESIESFRQNNVIKVTVQGDNTQHVSIEWLEEKFRSEGDQRRVVPSHDILQHNAKFPLHETSDGFLTQLHTEFEKRMQVVEATINEKASLIAEQISKPQTKQVTAQNITEMFTSPNAGVKRQMQREIENALDADNLEAKKAKTVEAVKATFGQGIDIKLISENKAKWGALNNRRGQLGENKTVAAIAQALENFMGISVSGMKTHTYLRQFLEDLNIKLTYRNEYDPATKKMTKTNEVEHDNVSTWIEEGSLVIAVVQSKTMEIKPSKSNFANQTQNGIKHAVDALKQVQKDFKTFQEMFPDIQESMLNRIR